MRIWASLFILVVGALLRLVEIQTGAVNVAYQTSQPMLIIEGIKRLPQTFIDGEKENPCNASEPGVEC